MATLTGRTIASSYTELLKTTSASGVTGSLDTVQDGDATDSALQISTAGVKSTGTLEVAGTSLLSGNVTLAEDVTGIPALQPELRDQAAYYATLVNTGIISPNEAREAIGKEPVDGFDEPRVPQNIAGSAVNPEEGGRPTESQPIEEE